MGNEITIPGNFGSMPASFRAFLNPEDDSLDEGIGQSYGVIKYKGKVWSLRYRGQQHMFLRDDGTPSGHLDVIILGQAKSKSKSYYPDYKDDSADRPMCASIDGIVPDMDVPAKQAETCALCPRNQRKMNQNGRMGKECTDFKRLAVLVLPSMTTKMLGGTGLVEPVFLRVPPDSLNSLASLGEVFKQHGLHYASVVTRIHFEPSKAHPCMVFRPLQQLTEKEAPVIQELMNNPLVGRITGNDVARSGLVQVQTLSPPGTVATGLTAPVASTTPPVSSFPTPQPLALSTPVLKLVENSLSSSTVGAPPATQNVIPLGNYPTIHASIGHGSAPSAAITPPPITSTVNGTPTEGVAAPEASDTALDSMIAGLLKKHNIQQQ